MGFSARYHAASLAAVFLALAIGILIGAAVGDDAVKGIRGNLEDNLTADVENARQRSDELAGDLNRSEEFSAQIYPALVEKRLQGKRIGLLALGGLPSDVSDSINAALEPTGAKLAAVGVVREPVDANSLDNDLSKTRFAGLSQDPDLLQALGTGTGRQLVLGGSLIDKIRDQLFSRASGEFANLDGLVIVRQQPTDLNNRDRASANALETGLLDGIEATAVTAVGAEQEDADPSSIGTFEGANMSSVDDVDRTAGQVALVFALLGAQGNFGTKDSADQLLPDLLAPTPPLVQGDSIDAPSSGGGGSGNQQGTSSP